MQRKCVMIAAVAALAPMSAAGTISPFSSTAFNGGDQAFLDLTGNGTLEQAVLESRIGNANPEAGVWELGLWRLGAVGSPLDQAGRGIGNGEVAEFSISYDGGTGLSMSIDGAEVSSDNIGGAFTDIFIRLRGTEHSTVALSALAFDGQALQISSVSATNGVEYLRIRNNGNTFGAFTLTGLQSFAWDGTRPNNSALAAQFKFTNVVVPAPASAGLLGLAGLAAARRRR